MKYYAYFLKKGNYTYSIFVLFLVLFISSCAIKAPEPHSVIQEIPYRILFVTPQLKFHDTGFVKHYNNQVHLELYTLGKPLYKIIIDKDKICSQGDCYPKSFFIKYIFGDYAYDDLLEDIILQRDIYNGENRISNENGLIQTINKQGSSISYIRKHNIMKFSDSKRKIRIMLDSTPFNE